MAIKGPVGVILVGALIDFIQVFVKIRAENAPIAILIFGPMMVLFVITSVDWLFGTD